MSIAPENFVPRSSRSAEANDEKALDRMTDVYALLYTSGQVNVELLAYQLSGNSNAGVAGKASDTLLHDVIEPLEKIRDHKKSAKSPKIREKLLDTVEKINELKMSNHAKMALQNLNIAIEHANNNGFWEWAAQQKGKGSGWSL